MSVQVKLFQTDVDNITSAINNRIKTSKLGVANGVATLDANALIPTSQLPESAKGNASFANAAAFPATGEVGRLYIAEDSDASYYWDGAAYVKMTANVDSTILGAANGVATLDGGGKVPANQLPSYVDDVLEFADAATFPAAGETGKIYVAIDTGYTFRWSGTLYVQIGTDDSAAVDLTALII